MEIWPIDEWSRKIIIDTVSNQKIEFTLNQTTMGTPALRMNNIEDYEKALSTIKDIEIEN
jgi:hypothetical protein